MDFDYRLPETDRPAITIRRTALGRVLVLVNGAAVRGREGVYEIPGADGETHLLKVSGAWTGLRVTADGWEVPLEPPTPLWSRALIFAPLFLIVGGLIGACLGVIGAAVNLVIGRSSARLPLRTLAMLLVLALGLGGWIGAGALLTGVSSSRVSYATGTCLEGITPETDLVSQAPQTVDCGTAHDGEVVGTFDAPGGTTYPGGSGLLDAARAQCPVLFTAYVGADFNASSLDVLPVVPTEVAWAAGTREISCVAITTDRTKLTGSVRGSGR